MGRHVISALQYMIVIWLIIRHDVVENLIHIGTDIRVCILVYCESAGCMLHKIFSKADWGSGFGSRRIISPVIK